MTVRLYFPFRTATDGQPLKQEACFSAVVGDGADTSSDLLDQFNGLPTPRSCCLDSNLEKDVCMCVCVCVYFQVPDTSVLLSAACLAAAPCTVVVELSWGS